MTIASVLREKGSAVIAVSPTTTVQEIAEIIAAKRIGAVLVLEDDSRLAGIVSERDVIKAVATQPEGIQSVLARDVMTRAVTTVTPQTTREEAMEIMNLGYFRHLPVIENDMLVGIISIRDLVKAEIQAREQMADDFRSYIYEGAVSVSAGRSSSRGFSMPPSRPAARPPERSQPIALSAMPGGSGKTAAGAISSELTLDQDASNDDKQETSTVLEITADEWEEIKLQALKQIVAATLDSPEHHLAYVRERIFANNAKHT